MTALDINGGSFESIAGLPDVLGLATPLQFLFDNGDSIWYADGIAAKDLPSPNLKKAASLRVTVDIVFPAASLTLDSGSPQSAIVNQPFADALRVRVVDAYGNGVPNVSVGFSAPTEGASALLSTASETTDANGYATITAVANTVAGTYDVVASVAGVAKTATFVLTNAADAASQLAATGGDAQSATVLEAFANPLVVHASDAFGNAVAGATIAFLTPAGGAGAVLSATSATTDADGNASVTATANAIAGGFFVAATLDAQQVTFALTNLAGPATTLAAASGTPQSATVGEAFANPLVVHVTDAEGNAVAGASVSFAAPSSGASATLSSSNATTDANGDASVSATANTIAGGYAVTATLGGQQATFSLTNLAGPPAVATVTGGTPQSAIVGHAFANPLVVHVTDAEGNAIPGVTVTFGTPSTEPARRSRRRMRRRMRMEMHR